ncbi:MAG: hypothetical protein K2X93_27775 [Candidatus Obscuribacterales bacterium]|nr:hypothetical protein [Candidatus Obscuribacterales bacterium]
MLSTAQGSPDFKVGSVIFDRYKILNYNSSGSNGRVVKAQDIELKIEVALKVFITNVSSDRQLVRFQSEDRALILDVLRQKDQAKAESARSQAVEDKKR